MAASALLRRLSGQLDLILEGGHSSDADRLDFYLLCDELWPALIKLDKETGSRAERARLEVLR